MVERLCAPPPVASRPEVGEVGGCYGLVCGYASEVVNVAEDSHFPAVERPCDEAGDILEVSCHPKENRKADVSLVSPFEGEANQRPVSTVQGQFAVGPSNIC